MASVYKKADEIASRYGRGRWRFCLTNVRLPGSGWQYWFAGPNLGDPFDRETAAAIYAELEAAGLLDADGCLRTKTKRGAR